MASPRAVAPDQDPREVFADWLLAPENPWFARSIVNRIWYWLLGRGIVHEPDDIRPDNPPANPELLAYLEQELIASHYDLKHIYRLILNSQTYQLSSIPRERPPRGRRPLRVLPAAPPGCRGAHRRRLPDHRHHRRVLQPHPRAVHLHSRRPALHRPARRQHHQRLPGMFGRPPRDTGLESERNNQLTAEQRLHLLNSSHIQLKIQQSAKLQALAQASRAASRASPSTGSTWRFCRATPPTTELQVVARLFPGRAQATSGQAAVDLAWALINSAEFLYRH